MIESGDYIKYDISKTEYLEMMHNIHIEVKEGKENRQKLYFDILRKERRGGKEILEENQKK